MNDASPLLLIGIGTAGASIARGIRRAFDEPLRMLIVDTDASTSQPNDNFLLLGGNRLSGQGTGGDIVAGSLAADDSIKSFDGHLEGVRLAVIVTALGGGTGGGATIEVPKYLATRGIPSVVFATTPFTFEGEDQQRNARGVISSIQESANALFLLPLDKLVGSVDNMDSALRQAVDTVASGVTLFWRLLEKPGYLRLDLEHLRHLIAGVGRGRFAVVTTQGPERAKEAVDRLVNSEILSFSSAPVKTIVCGILAGNDLLLSEVGTIADGVRQAFGGASFNLATVNDEKTFSGRLSVVVLLFETDPRAESSDGKSGIALGSRPRRKSKDPLASSASSGGRFKNSNPTIWNGEDLDTPTFLRRGISLDF